MANLVVDLRISDAAAVRRLVISLAAEVEKKDVIIAKQQKRLKQYERNNRRGARRNTRKS